MTTRKKLKKRIRELEKIQADLVRRVRDLEHEVIFKPANNNNPYIKRHDRPVDGTQAVSGGPDFSFSDDTMNPWGP